MDHDQINHSVQIKITFVVRMLFPVSVYIGIAYHFFITVAIDVYNLFQRSFNIRKLVLLDCIQKPFDDTFCRFCFGSIGGFIDGVTVGLSYIIIFIVLQCCV